MSFDLSKAPAWSFAGGEWRAGAGGGMEPVDALDADSGRGMQGCRFAFAADTSYRDFRAAFQARHDMALTGGGVCLSVRPDLPPEPGGG